MPAGLRACRRVTATRAAAASAAGDPRPVPGRPATRTANATPSTRRTRYSSQRRESRVGCLDIVCQHSHRSSLGDGNKQPVQPKHHGRDIGRCPAGVAEHGRGRRRRTSERPPQNLPDATCRGASSSRTNPNAYSPSSSPPVAAAPAPHRQPWTRGPAAPSFRSQPAPPAQRRRPRQPRARKEPGHRGHLHLALQQPHGHDQTILSADPVNE